MQVIDHRALGAVDLELVKPLSSGLAPLRHLAQIERGDRALLHADASGELGKKDGEIFNIGRNRFPIASSTLRSEGARNADHASKRANNVLTEIYTVRPHIADLA